MPAVGDIHYFNLCLDYNLMGGDVHSQNVVGEDVCDDNIAVEEGEKNASEDPNGASLTCFENSM